MQNRWSAEEASSFVARYQGRCSEDLALLVYASRLVGAERGLVLHGGGNASVKGSYTNLFGEREPALFVKGSGRDMAGIAPEGFSPLNLCGLLRLRALDQLGDEDMQNELRLRLLDPASPAPSIETLAHAFLPPKYIVHTHADAILVLTNQLGGKEKVGTALGSRAIVLPYYCKPGFCLAKAAAAAFQAASEARGMIWMQHGIVTWGDTGREAYLRMIELVSLAEEFAAQNRRKPARILCPAPFEVAARRAERIAPIVRGLLVGTGEEAAARRGAIVLPLVSAELLDVINAEGAKDLLTSPPLTTDHLIRTKPLPLWIDAPDYGDTAAVAQKVREAINGYGKEYLDYHSRHSAGRPTDPYDDLPRLILMPGTGALAAGPDLESALIVRDIAAQSLLAKAAISAMGGSYEGLPESDLFHMEYDPFQRAKLAVREKQALAGRTALVTGAAGAIGSGICEELLRQGCAVALADLPGERLTALVDELAAAHGAHVMAAPFDVTDRREVASAFAAVARVWGGLDLVVLNAGVAHVAQLADLDLEAFQRLERVNVDGTLNLLGESALHFRLQNCGGDIVLISTKNVLAPGAGFGAYSATKAAAHQLARIASLEMAGMGVRVNMVAPDAVFSHGSRRSGLWETVGPDRMRARGLDEKGLESYYQNRNLLKARVTARHVANAVIYFATRQTPTTGATIPVDGGLPDATPR